MNKWELWWARVKFEDDPTQIKRRPVLIIDNAHAILLSLKVTSHAPRPHYEGEYVIRKWSEAGLTKASTVRTSKKLRLLESDFDGKIGRLDPVDILAIQRLLQ